MFKCLFAFGLLFVNSLFCCMACYFRRFLLFTCWCVVCWVPRMNSSTCSFVCRGTSVSFMGLFTYLFYFFFDKLVGFMSFASGHLTVLLTLWPRPFYRLDEHAIYKPVIFIASFILCTLMSLLFFMSPSTLQLCPCCGLNDFVVFIFSSICWGRQLYSFGRAMELMNLSFFVSPSAL